VRPWRCRTSRTRRRRTSSTATRACSADQDRKPTTAVDKHRKPTAAVGAREGAASTCTGYLEHTHTAPFRAAAAAAPQSRGLECCRSHPAPARSHPPPPSPPSPRTNRTRRVLHPVLIGHAASPPLAGLCIPCLPPCPPRLPVSYPCPPRLSRWIRIRNKDKNPRATLHAPRGGVVHPLPAIQHLTRRYDAHLSRPAAAVD
jgi:hypothetical protein